MRALFPFIERIFADADAGYQGPRVAKRRSQDRQLVVEIVNRHEMHKFIVLPKRWIAERTLGWIAAIGDFGSNPLIKQVGGCATVDLRRLLLKGHDLFDTRFSLVAVRWAGA